MSLPDDFEVRVGDALDVLKDLPNECVQTCVTSPPYWGLRDYGVDGQLGLEPTPEEYVEKLVSIFAEVRRVLRDDGTLWLNLGDSYAGSWGAQSRGGPPSDKSTLRGNGHVGGGPKVNDLSEVQVREAPKQESGTGSTVGLGLKPKDMVGVPWRAHTDPRRRKNELENARVSELLADAVGDIRRLGLHGAQAAGAL